MTKTKAPRSRRGAATRRRAGGGGESRQRGGVEPIRTFGLDPSFFSLGARDTRGLIVQLLSVAGLAVGLFASLGAYGSTTLGGSEQLTQLAYLASLFGLAALPVLAAAGTDAGVAWLVRERGMEELTAARLSAFVPPVVALVVGLLIAPLLFRLGGQALYLALAGILLAALVAIRLAGWLREANRGA
jgi:hypothetical protein